MNTEWPSAMARHVPTRGRAEAAWRLLPSAFPLLPLEEEARLNDMPLRENLIERVFAYYRWTEMLEEYRTGSRGTASRWRTAGPLVRFHTAHKLTLVAHSPS